ncbi:MAG: uracil-DNA glycosylase [Pseudomonadota bacterium]
MHFPENWLAFTGLKSDDIPQIEEEAYPPTPVRYKALECVAPEQVKVVILGQDPYHGAGEAHGLAFSVQQGVRMPPSLRNIFKELSSDLGVPVPQNTDLTRWAKQGVLLLNTALSVAPDKAGSHANRGWVKVTNAIIYALGHTQQNCAFVLWGKPAQAKRGLIEENEFHFVIESAHPSPLSAHRGFLGSQPFSKINTWLQERGESIILWE